MRHAAEKAGCALSLAARSLPGPRAPLTPPPARRVAQYFRDMTAGLKDVGQHEMWISLEAGAGVVAQHDYDPTSSCAGWEGCDFWSHGKPGAWWNVTNDPFDAAADESPLWAFATERALNRLALRTQLIVSSDLGGARQPASRARGAPANFTLFAHQNCYNGHGGIEIDTNPVEGLTVGQCTARCDADASCDCVVTTAGGGAAVGECWKRRECVPADFEADAATARFAVYVKKDGPAPPPKVGGALLPCCPAALLRLHEY